MLTESQIAFLNSCVLCWLATVDDLQQPNVSPKEMFVAIDETSLLIANIASPQSISNISNNSKVCVSIVDVFIQKGWKLYGTAEEILADHPSFSGLKSILTSRFSDAFPILSIISVTVTAVKPIIAPSYFLFPTTTESSQIRSALETYRVADLMAEHASQS